MASNSGCTEVLVEGASTPNLPRVASESVMGPALECHNRGGPMIDRDEYVQKLKAQIAQFHARRDEAMAELRRIQNASADAWGEMMRGADTALKSMQDAFERARK